MKQLKPKYLLEFEEQVCRDPIITPLALTLASVGTATGITAVTGLTVTAASLSSALGSLLVSVAVGALKSVLFRPDKPRAIEPDGVKAVRIDSLPPIRSAYGVRELGGFVIAREVVGDQFYFGYLMNSRASEGPFTLRVDGREVPLTGDIEDLDGPGAQPTDPNPESEQLYDILVSADTNNPYLRAWLTRGDHTDYPADILTEWPGITETPLFEGLTILWCAFRAGPASQRSKRWPKGVPQVTLEGPWSLVYDPRTGQTAYSNTAALVALDILRNENGDAVPDRKFDFASFAAGADIDEQEIPLKAGGTEKRYAASGLWEVDPNEEPFRAVQPALQASMATIVEVEGQWRYIPGVYQAPDVFLTDHDVVGDEFTIDLVSDPAERANAARVRFVSPDRNYEYATFSDGPDGDGTYIDAAALAEDMDERSLLSADLSWVTSKGQAARIRRRMVEIARAQKRIKSAFYWKGLEAHVGTGVSFTAASLPPKASGDYICANWAVTFEVDDAEAGTFRVRTPMLLRETSPGFDFWDPEDEPEVAGPPAQTSQLGPPVMTGLSVVQEVVTTAGGDLIAARVSAPPSTTTSVFAYRMRWKKTGDTEYVDTVSTDSETLNAADRVELRALGLELGSHVFEMRAVSPLGESDWATITETITAPADATAAPTLTGAYVNQTLGTRLTVAAPDDPSVRRAKFYRGTTSTFGSATEIEMVLASQDTETEWHDPPLSDDTYYYWATILNTWGVESPESNTLTIVIDEGM